jgi:O-antigen/teichoic acid export membrane protein
MKKLLGVAVFSGLLTLLRMASGFVIVKLAAFYTGPSGVALLGQLQSLATALNGVVGAPASTGVVRYTAQHYKTGYDSCAPWWRASVRCLLLMLLVIMAIAFVFARPLSVFLFDSDRWAWLIVACGLALPFAAANTLITSVVNGIEQYRRYILLGLVSLLVSTSVMIGLIIQYRLIGALLAAAIFTGMSGVVLILLCLRQPWFKLQYWWGSVDRARLSDIAGYVLMSVTSAICVAAAAISVRKILAAEVGWAEAGNWHAVYKISEAYLGVITLGLATYYLPRLATLHNYESIRKETIKGILLLFPVVSMLALCVYLGRDLAISLLFTSEFNGARSLFAIQLIGDVLKILSWVAAYPMLARGATSWYIVSEIGFSVTFTGATYFLVPHFGAQGANIAFAGTYLMYFLFLAATFRHVMTGTEAKKPDAKPA